MMKFLPIFLVFLLLTSCGEISDPSPLAFSRITAYVHWDYHGLEGKKIQLVQTGETKYTDSNGEAAFSVAAGKYVLRAFDINRGGPCCGSIDFDVQVNPGEHVTVDIFDCLPCL